MPADVFLFCSAPISFLANKLPPWDTDRSLPFSAQVQANFRFLEMSQRRGILHKRRFLKQTVEKTALKHIYSKSELTGCT
jgi:hypothetical protein